MNTPLSLVFDNGTSCPTTRASSNAASILSLNISECGEDFCQLNLNFRPAIQKRNFHFRPVPVVSCGWWPPSASQASHPWGMVAAGGGSDKSSINKLEERLDLAMLKVAFLCLLCCHGGGRGAAGVFISGLLRSAVASELGFPRWIRSVGSCSTMSSFSTTRCSGAMVPSGAFSVGG
jgi:hypothetical protein